MIRLNDILNKVSSYNTSADLDIIRKAYVFCAKVHQGQTRLSGEPYLVHPMEVSAILADLKLDVASVVTGLLHDTVEDTSVTLRDIELKFGKRVAEIVDRLSRREGEVYVDFIERVAGDIDAVYVKLADIRDNLYRRGRVVTGMEKRYLKAISTLEVVRKAHHDAKLRDDMLKRGTDV